MMKFELGKKFSLIAAICYTVYALCNVINYWISFDLNYITMRNVVFWIASLGVAVTLFMKNKKAIVAAIGIHMCLEAYAIIIIRADYWSICSFVAYTSAVALIILSIKDNTVVKIIWFIPALTLLLRCMFYWNDCYYLRFLSPAWRSMVLSIVQTVAFLFAGMWLKEDARPAQVTPVNEYATFDPHAMNSVAVSTSTIGGADKLKLYKELLDSGTITQEEFDDKKKQILEL